MQTSFVCDARDGTTIRPHVFGKVQLSRHSFFLYVLIEQTGCQLTMTTKRPQDDCGRRTEKKKKKKSSEETVRLCSVLEDEQVKTAVKQAWSQRTHYSHGEVLNSGRHTVPPSSLTYLKFVTQLLITKAQFYVTQI